MHSIGARDADFWAPPQTAAKFLKIFILPNVATARERAARSDARSAGARIWAINSARRSTSPKRATHLPDVHGGAAAVREVLGNVAPQNAELRA